LRQQNASQSTYRNQEIGYADSHLDDVDKIRQTYRFTNWKKKPFYNYNRIFNPIFNRYLASLIQVPITQRGTRKLGWLGPVANFNAALLLLIFYLLP
jgi:hypothetical protein